MFRLSGNRPAFLPSTRCVTRALTAADGPASVGDLRRAIGHYQRAAYEAAEAGILHCLTQINEFKNDYALVPISSALPSWATILADARAAQNRLGVPRQTGDERVLDHEAHVQLFDRLAAASNDCDIAREELNKGMRTERTSFIRWAFTTVLAVLALGFAAVSTIRHWDDGKLPNKSSLSDEKAHPL